MSIRRNNADGEKQESSSRIIPLLLLTFLLFASIASGIEGISIMADKEKYSFGENVLVTVQNLHSKELTVSAIDPNGFETSVGQCSTSCRLNYAPKVFVEGNYTLSAKDMNGTYATAIFNMEFGESLPARKETVSVPEDKPSDDEASGEDEEDEPPPDVTERGVDTGRVVPEVVVLPMNASVVDSKQREVKASYKLIDSDSAASLENKLKEERFTAGVDTNVDVYDVEIEIEHSAIKDMTIRNVVLENNSEIVMKIDELDELNVSTSELEFVEAYSIDPTEVNFTNATVTVTAIGDAVYKCAEWNFTEQVCYGEWKFLMNTVPGQEYELFLTPDDPAYGEIKIDRAVHLDSSRQFVSDIFNETKAKDGVWSEEVQVGEYVRVRFTENLTSINDITVYARSAGVATIEVYYFNSTEKITEITRITDEKYYKTLLTDMEGTDKRFDLKVVGAPVEFDHIVDPQHVENKIVGEFGILHNVNISWQWVSFEHMFETTPVVQHSMDYHEINYEGANGGAGDITCLTRINGTNESGFFARADNWDSRNLFYDPCPVYGMNLHWVAMEEGTHTLSDNSTVVEVAKVSRNGGADCGYKGAYPNAVNYYNYANTYAFTPYVFASVQTANDDDEINVYIKDCSGSINVEYSSTCAEIGLNGMEPSTGDVCTAHTSAEDVGIMIWGVDSSAEDTPTNGITSNNSRVSKWSVVRSPDEVAGISNDPYPAATYPTSYDSTFGDNVTALVAGIRIDGGDGLVPIFVSNPASDLLYLLALEDENGDDDQTHTPEPLKIIVFNESSGFIFSNEVIDYTAPNITDVSEVGITDIAALVLWTTDEDANSTVNYGEDKNLGTYVYSATKESAHSIAISGLSAATQYFYNVTSCDSQANCETVGPFNFTTVSEPDIIAPIISGVDNGTVTRFSTTIVWDTNETANSTLEYGIDKDLGTYLYDSLFATTHSIDLTGISHTTTYYYNVSSCDVTGNCNVSGPYNFTTIANYAPTIRIDGPEHNRRYIYNTSNATIDITVDDANADLVCVEVYGDNSTTIDTSAVIFSACTDGTETQYIYSWNATPRKDGANLGVIYHFDNRSEYGENSSYFNDFSSGIGNDATCTVCPEWNRTGGKFGGAYKYDGSKSQYINMGATNLFDAALAQQTIEMWFKADDVSSGTAQMLYEEGGATNGMNIYIQSGTLYAGAWCENCAPAWQGGWVNTTVTSGSWHYVAFIFSANDHMTMVYDGEVIVASGLDSTMNSHTGDNILGASGSTKMHTGDAGSFGSYFSGYIDEFAAYDDYAMSVEEALSHSIMPPGPYYWFVNGTDGIVSVENSTYNFSIFKPDRIDPVINLLNVTPADVNQTENVTIIVNATDDINISAVWMDLNGANYTLERNGDIFTIAYDTTLASVGQNNLTIYANDSSDNKAVSQNGTFNVENSLPPASVTLLENISSGAFYIFWNWSIPTDVDFESSIIYFNGSNIVNTTNNFFNATGLNPATTYTITVHTKDIAGNVNDSDVNSTISTDNATTTLILMSSSDPVEVYQEYDIYAYYNSTEMGDVVENATCFTDGETTELIRDYSKFDSTLPSSSGYSKRVYGNNISRTDLFNLSSGYDVKEYHLYVLYYKEGIPADDLQVYFRCDNVYTLDPAYIIANFTAAESPIDDVNLNFTEIVIDKSKVTSENCTVLYSSPGSNELDDYHFKIMNATPVNTFLSVNNGSVWQTATWPLKNRFGVIYYNRTYDYNPAHGRYEIESTVLHESGTVFYNVTCQKLDYELQKEQTNSTAVDNLPPITQITLINPDPAQYGLENVTIEWYAGDNSLDFKRVNVTYPNGSLVIQSVISPLVITPSQLSVKGNYTVTVCANDTTGLKNSTTGNFSVVDTLPPRSVTNLTNLSNGYTWIFFNWTNSTDVDFAEAILYINGTNVLNTTNTSFNATGLGYKTEYMFIVHTKDYDGNVNDTDVSVSVTTDLPPDLSAPNITMVGPLNNSERYPRNITFVAFTYDENPSNCTLYGNFSGIWAMNETVNITNLNQSANFTINLSVGEYIWNVQCTDNFTNVGVGYNYTLQIEYVSGNLSDIQNNNLTLSLDIDSVLYNPYNSYSGILNVTIYNGTTPIVVFAHDFDYEQLNLSSIKVVYNSTYVSANVPGNNNITLRLPKDGDQCNIHICENVFDMADCNEFNEYYVYYATDDPYCEVSVSGTSANDDPDNTDFQILESDLNFSKYNPVEGEEIIVNATVRNTGLTEITNVTVSFMDITADTWLGNVTIWNLIPGEYMSANITYRVGVGRYNISATVDPNDDYLETDETNNNASRILNGSLWQIYYGNVTALIKLGGHFSEGDNDSIAYTWDVSDATGTILYFADVDSDIEFYNLQALGRTAAFGPALSDFQELDFALNQSQFPDNISTYWQTDYSSASDVTTMVLYDREIRNIPIINSTNVSSFFTGILWDTTDDTGDGQYDSDEEDVVFVTRVNETQQGAYAVTDYEIRVPAKLTEYKGTKDYLYVYMEIK